MFSISKNINLFNKIHSSIIHKSNLNCLLSLNTKIQKFNYSTIKSANQRKIIDKDMIQNKNINLYSNTKSNTLYNKYSKFYFSDFNKPNNNESNKEGINEEFKEEYEQEEDINTKSRRIFYVFFSVAVIMGCVYYGVSIIEKENKIQQNNRLGKVTYVGKSKIGGNWELTDFNGNKFGSRSLSGKYYLIYFGFTKCPDVCPASMTKLAKAIKAIKENSNSKYFDLEVVFVSCDPDRDSLEVIKKYCEVFSHNIIGVTGSSNEDPVLKKMLKDFKIHSSKIIMDDVDAEVEKKTFTDNMKSIAGANENQLKFYDEAEKRNTSQNYSLDHTIVTYLMGQNNEFITYLSSSMSSSDMANTIIESIIDDMKTNYS